MRRWELEMRWWGKRALQKRLYSAKETYNLQMHAHTHTHEEWCVRWYGVATISRLLQIIRLFCKRALQKRLYSAKETYNYTHTHEEWCVRWYGVATISRLLQIIRLFAKEPFKRDYILQKRPIITHTYMKNDVLDGMGWLRLVGSAKL